MLVGCICDSVCDSMNVILLAVHTANRMIVTPYVAHIKSMWYTWWIHRWV
jgi:hypothetical protein